MSSSAITTRTERIWRWRKERLPVVRQRGIPAAAIGLYRRLDLAVCIIVTIWSPELPLRTSRLRVGENCGRGVPADLSCPTWLCPHDDPWSPNTLIGFEGSFQSYHRLPDSRPVADGWNFGEAHPRFKLDERALRARAP